MPITTPIPTPPAPPAGTPLVSAPQVAPTPTYEVICVEVDSIEKAVTILEEAPDLDNPGKKKMAPHSCVRRVNWAKLELDPRPVTQPTLSIVVESLDSLPFEVNKSYLVSFQPV